MTPMEDPFGQDEPTYLIGPGSADDPATLLEEARQRVRDEDRKNRESSKLARRLLVALLAIAVLGTVFYLLMPRFGLRLPPLVPVLCFISIAAGALLTFREDASED